MASFRFFFPSLHSQIFTLVFGLLLCFPTSTFAGLGINYGRIANDLPPPERVVPIIQSIGINKVKIFDADPSVIRAFANTNMELIVGMPNENLQDVAANPDSAMSWITSNIQAYLPATQISGIAVGNEVLTMTDTSLSNSLALAMQNLYDALLKLGLDKQVIVTTTHALAILENSYPPSSGAFRQDLTQYLTPILDLQTKIGSSFCLNVYPFFAYKENPSQISLDFAVLKENQLGFTDPATNLRYDNLLFAQIDAVYSALNSLGYKDLAIQVSETGWPSNGDENEVGATLDNAREYNGNLMKLVAEKKGTPMKSNIELDAYIFALFNENMKPGPTSERNFGLFKPDGTPAYPFGVIDQNKNHSVGPGNSPSIMTSNSSYKIGVSWAYKVQYCLVVLLSCLLF